MEIFFIVIFIIAFLFIFALNKAKNKDRVVTYGLITFYILTIFFAGIVLPYHILSLVLREKLFIVILSIISVILFVYCIIVVITALKNKNIKESNKIKDIYIRDIDVKYSPAVVSYLMNGKIEQDKDLVAVLLNLCAEKILKIEYDKNSKLNIIDMNNKEKVEVLSKSDLLAYKIFTTKITTTKINKWKKAVYEEYMEYNFSKKNKSNLASSVVMLYFIFIILSMIAVFVFGKNGTLVLPGRYGEIFTCALMTIFFAGWEAAIFSSTGAILRIIDKKENSTFKDIYTKKGAREYDKWLKFKRFVKDFSNIDKVELESVVIFEKYLAYAIALNVNKEYKEVEFDIIKEKMNFDINSIINDISNIDN